MTNTFAQRMYIARTRCNLEQEALAITAWLRAADVEITFDLLCHRLILAVMNAQPRSRLVAWHLNDSIVEAIVRRVAADVVKSEDAT